MTTAAYHRHDISERAGLNYWLAGAGRSSRTMLARV